MEWLVDESGIGLGPPATVLPAFPIFPGSAVPLPPGVGVVAATGMGTAEIVGFREAVPLSSRLVWASLAGRYQPSHPPGEACLFGMDFSFVIPAEVGILAAGLNIFNNTFLSPDVSADWVIGPMVISGRGIWARLQGGVEGSDYQLRWLISDTDGNVYPRTALVLCSNTN